MLRTLAEKTDPGHAAVLIVDVQNDFCADNGAMHKEGRDLGLVQIMVPRLARFITEARAAAVPLVWIRNLYNRTPNWYLSEVWLEQAHRRRRGLYVERPVCQPDDWSGDFYHVRPAPEDVIVTKHRFGAFENTDLELILRSRGIRTVIMTGVATNVCVETTARQAFLKDYYVVFTRDGTATYTQAEHDGALANIDNYFGEVVSCHDVAACWQPVATLAR